MDGAKMAGKWRGRHAPNDVGRGAKTKTRVEPQRAFYMSQQRLSL
jgi:hypothetical protein